jgi:hypothetical protein
LLGDFDPMTVVAFTSAGPPARTRWTEGERHPAEPHNHKSAGWRRFSPFRLLSRRKQSRPAVALGGSHSVSALRDGGAFFPPWDGGDPLCVTLTVAAEHKIEEVSYDKVNAHPELKGLDGLAQLLGEITYGEMMELGVGIGQTGSGGPITQLELPAALHLWAMERQP